MRAVWICILLFSLLILAVCWNAHYIRNSAALLTQTAQRLQYPEERADALTELESFWEKNRTYFSLSVSFRELDHFSEILIHLRWAHDTQNEEEFHRYRLLLSEAIQEISRTERLNVENLC